MRQSLSFFVVLYRSLADVRLLTQAIRQVSSYIISGELICLAFRCCFWRVLVSLDFVGTQRTTPLRMTPLNKAAFQWKLSNNVALPKVYLRRRKALSRPSSLCWVVDLGSMLNISRLTNPNSNDRTPVMTNNGIPAPIFARLLILATPSVASIRSHLYPTDNHALLGSEVFVFCSFICPLIHKSLFFDTHRPVQHNVWPL